MIFDICDEYYDFELRKMDTQIISMMVMMMWYIMTIMRS